MNKVKYQIFISSTYDDLKEERDQVIKACLEMGHIPVGMEMFSAADEEQWQIITRQIDESDYYVIIVANRYGSMVDGVSYTEKEYDYAVSKGVPTLGFVLDSKAPWPTDRQEKEKKARSKLEAFKKKVEAKPVNFWNSKEDLHGKCAIALGKTFNTQPRPGWVRSSEEIGPEIAKEISHLSNENRELRDQNDKLQKLTQLTSYENIYSILSNNAVRLSELPESISEVLSKISYELGTPNINSIYMFWFTSIRLREGIVINDSLYSGDSKAYLSYKEDNTAIMPYVYFYEELGLVTRSSRTEPTLNPAYTVVKYIFLLSEEGKQFLLRLRLNGIIKRIEDALDTTE